MEFAKMRKFISINALKIILLPLVRFPVHVISNVPDREILFILIDMQMERKLIFALMA
jgi:hypothetical protein